MDDSLERVKQDILAWAAPNEELGWVGSPEVAQHAEELANHLWDQGWIDPSR